MSTTVDKGFSTIRRIFFPVHQFELKKVLPMGMIFFFVLFNYTCLRNVKDSLIITSSGAETLSFLKTFCVAPCAIIFMVFYVKASDILSNEKLFYFTLTPFIVFFGLFAFLLYPYQDMIHPSSDFILGLKGDYPSFSRFFDILAYWTYSLFYILSEIWGSAILSLSFWQFANQTCKTSEAKRFYSFFALIGQFAMIATGFLGAYFSQVRSDLPEGVDPWGYSLNWLMGMVVVSGLATMFIYRWIYSNVLTDKRFYDKPNLPGVNASDAGAKKKKKPGLIQSFKVILGSPYLMLIALLVISYGVSVNLVEGLWKSQLKNAYTDYNSLNVFMNNFTIWTGIATIAMLIVGGNLLRLFSWTTVAVITPLVMLLGGGAFFAFVLYGDAFAPLVEKWGTTSLMVSVMLGAAVVVITKSTKYALFDITKEMSYIPLSEEMKVKGKAVVDVVAGRLGKTGGAGAQVLLFLIIAPNYVQIAPYSAGLFIGICALWVLAVKLLGKRVNAAVEAKKQSGEDS